MELKDSEVLCAASGRLKAGKATGLGGSGFGCRKADCEQVSDGPVE